MNMFSNNSKAVRYAFENGYRVLKNGDLMSPSGQKIKLFLDKEGYFRFYIKNRHKIISVHVHRLCSFQKYGELAFACDCIRHLDGNSQNNSWDNIEIGTYRDNQMDKYKEERIKSATKASHSGIMKWDAIAVLEIKKYYASVKSYRLTMIHFNISSKGTLSYILNKR